MHRAKNFLHSKFPRLTHQIHIFDELCTHFEITRDDRFRVAHFVEEHFLITLGKKHKKDEESAKAMFSDFIQKQNQPFYFRKMGRGMKMLTWLLARLRRAKQPV